MSSLLTSGPGWEWLVVSAEGDDLVCRDCRATRFGGADDGQDNGVGASGFDVRAHPLYAGVSLPQSGRGIRSMRGCPIPKLPWYTPVKVFAHKTHEIAYGHLVDIGPSGFTHHAIDLTNALVDHLGLDLADGVYEVSYRIVGGAKYLPKP